jgi:hypothetical protein
MIMISVIVGMPVAMVGMSKCCEANDVYEETQNTDDEKLIEPMQLVSLPKTLESIKYNLHADEPGND